MTDESFDLEVYSGASFQLLFRVTDQHNAPVSLTNCTFRGQIKTKPNSPIVEETFSVVVLDRNAAAVRVSLTAEQTANLTNYRNYYDIECIDTTRPSFPKIYKVLRGRLIAVPQITEVVT